MGCNNCGNSDSSRHSVVSPPERGPVAASEQTMEGESPHTMDEMIRHTQKMTYEQLTSQRNQARVMWEAQAEEAMSVLTAPMKRIHIEELLSVYNLESVAPSPMSPEQALVALKTSLDRPDFAAVAVLYAGLKEEVDNRYNELVAKRILPIKH